MKLFRMFKPSTGPDTGKPVRQVHDVFEEFQRDGVAVVRNVLPPEVVEAAGQAWKQLALDIAEGKETEIKRSARFIHGGSLPAALDRISLHPHLVQIARRLVGEDVALYMNRLLIKDQIWNGPVASHQDIPYFHGSVDKLSIFVPLMPFTAETGNLTFVAGSHRYGNLGVRGTIEHDKFPPMPLVRPDVHPGDVILATFTVWHFSEAAAVECDRPVLQLAYQSASDGSYFGEPNEPRLICGNWKTDLFIRFRENIQPDG